MCGRWAVAKMGRLKQSFRQVGPDHSRKHGTPTAGGAFFVPIGVLVGLLYAWPFASSDPVQRTLAAGVALTTIACGLIGLADDCLNITKGTSKGLSPKLKLLLQVRPVYHSGVAHETPTSETDFGGCDLKKKVDHKFGFLPGGNHI